jgi:hypothetical protein
VYGCIDRPRAFLLRYKLMEQHVQISPCIALRRQKQGVGKHFTTFGFVRPDFSFLFFDEVNKTAASAVSETKEVSELKTQVRN